MLSDNVGKGGGSAGAAGQSMKLEKGDDDSNQMEDDSGDSRSPDDEGETDKQHRKNSDAGDSSAVSAMGSQNSQTVESMDTQEFLNQHNDECEVCAQPGNLLCCSTCSLVFHLECLRPSLNALPKEEDEWSCPHCIIQGIKGYKRHSKAWKAAAAGVRQMGRLRNENIQEKGDKDMKEDQPSEGDKKPAAKDADRDRADNTKTAEEGTAAVSEEPSADVAQDKTNGTPETTSKDKTPKTLAKSSTASLSLNTKRRNLALYKLADPFKPNLDPAAHLVVKGRRARRQPSIYQPQDCPASQWKSDEVPLHDESEGEDNSSQASDNEETPDVSSQQQASSPGKHSKEGNSEESKQGAATSTPKDADTATSKQETPNNPVETSNSDNGDPNFVICQFCMDDPSIPVCVFCGCRECFGKHEKDKIVKCVKCDDLYHSFCVGLKSTPSDKKWLCESCDKIPTEKSPTRKRASTSIFAKSRPRATPSAKSDGSIGSSSHTPKNKAVEDSLEKMTPTGSSEKKSRGRPPTKSKSPVGDATPMPSRKRGRPPKSGSPAESSFSKKRARTSASLTPSNKRDRPFKAAAASKSATSSASPPRKRGPGRPPKRSDSAGSSSEVKRRGPGRPPNSSRGPGRPPKSDASVSSLATSTTQEPAAPPEPVKISRSGRVVKRQTFHDEILEGEQHLKTSKTEESPQEIYTPAKSQPSTSGRARSKSNDSTESRKKLKAATKPDESNVAALQEALALDGDKTEMPDKEEDKEDEVLAPVRMKSVLSPPAPAIRPHLSEVKPNPVALVPDAVAKPAPAVTTPAATAENPSLPAGTSIDTKPVAAAAATLSSASSETAPKPTLALNFAAASSSAVATAPTAALTGVPRPAAVATAALASKKRHTTRLLDPKKLEAAVKALPSPPVEEKIATTKTPRRKPGARECMQLSRRFGVNVIPERSMNILLDYCQRGKVEHLIRMRERLDCHSRYLEAQLAGLEMLVKEKGETNMVVPPLPEPYYEQPTASKQRTMSEGSGGDHSLNVGSDRSQGKSPVPKDPSHISVGGSTVHSTEKPSDVKPAAVVKKDAMAPAPPLVEGKPAVAATPTAAAATTAAPSSVSNIAATTTTDNAA
jgi:hypothetical protein